MHGSVDTVCGWSPLSATKTTEHFIWCKAISRRDPRFLAVTLPVDRSSYSEFRRAMNTAITTQYGGFGRG